MNEKNTKSNFRPYSPRAAVRRHREQMERMAAEELPATKPAPCEAQCAANGATDGRQAIAPQAEAA